MSPAKALAMIIQMNLTTRNYQKLRNQAIEQGADIYPSYRQIKKMKRLCTPSNIQYKSDEVVVSIESTLKHQASRLLKLNPEIKEEMDNLKSIFPDVKFKFLYKYGAGKGISKSKTGNGEILHFNPISWKCCVVTFQQ